MTDTTQGQDYPPPVFGPDGRMMGNLTSAQGQPPQQPGAPSLAPQSPFAPPPQPPTPTAGPPPQGHINYPAKPQMGELQQNKEPPPDAKEYQKSAMGWASAFAVLGAIAGRFTRAPGGAALGAFGAAVKGWQTGNLQAYQSATDKWERESKQALDNNKLVLEKYKASLENYKLNIDEQMQEIQLTAANYHDKQMYDAALAKNHTLVAQLYEKGWRFTDQGYQYHAELSEKGQEIRQKAEQTGAYWLSPEGQARIPSLSPAQQIGVKGLIDTYTSKAVKGGETGRLVSMENQERAARGQAPMNAQEEVEFVGKANQQAHQPRSAAGMSLQQFKQENPNATSADIQEFQARQSEMNAAARTKGGREANLDIILRVTDSAIPAALDASEKVPRGNYVPINKIIQNGRVMKSDAATMQFGMANLQLAEGWAKAMNPTGVMREGDRDLALSFLSTATSKETYKALVEQLRTQIQRERAAIQSGKQSTISAPGETPSVSETTGAGWTDLGGGVRIREKP